MKQNRTRTFYIVMVLSVFSLRIFAQHLEEKDVKYQTRAKILTKEAKLKTCWVYKKDTVLNKPGPFMVWPTPHRFEPPFDRKFLDKQKEYLSKKFTYDTSGSLVSESYYDYDGKEMSRQEFEYTHDIYYSKIKYYVNNVLHSVTLYEYNNFMHCIAIKGLDSSGKKNYVERTTYKYDKNNNAIETVYYDRNKKRKGSKYISKYDSLNRETETLLPDKGRYVFEYNTNGTKKTWKIEHEKGGSIHFYEYDKNGNLVKDTYDQLSGENIHVDSNIYVNDKYVSHIRFIRNKKKILFPPQLISSDNKDSAETGTFYVYKNESDGSYELSITRYEYEKFK